MKFWRFATILLFVLSLGLFFLLKNQKEQTDKLRTENEVLKAEKQKQARTIEALKEKITELESKPISTTQEKTISKAFRKKFKENTFDVFETRLNKKETIGTYWKNKEGKILYTLENLSNALAEQGQKVLFATNAGIYTEERAPLGLFVEGGQQKVPLRKGTGYGNFYMQPNGVFLIGNRGAKIVTTAEYEQLSDSVISATQSGPLLLIGGKINSKFNKKSPNRKVRSGVGVAADGRIVFAISNDPVTFFNFALLFKQEFGCSDALYLDGVISQMYLPELERYEQGGSFAGFLAVSADSH